MSGARETRIARRWEFYFDPWWWAVGFTVAEDCCGDRVILTPSIHLGPLNWQWGWREEPDP